MPSFAANLTMMYPDMPFLDRFEAARKFVGQHHFFGHGGSDAHRGGCSCGPGIGRGGAVTSDEGKRGE